MFNFIFRQMRTILLCRVETITPSLLNLEYREVQMWITINLKFFPGRTKLRFPVISIERSRASG